MKNLPMKKLGPIIGIIVLIIVAILIFRRGGVRDEVDVRSLKLGKGDPCPGERVRLVQGDQYMRGIIEEGAKFEVIMNYYACNPLKRGDYILQHLSASLDPVVKILRGLPGDKFELKKDAEGQGWNLLINGDVVMWEAGNRPYFFGGKQPPTLSLYERSRKGILGPDEIIILGNVPPGTNDSGIFGIFSVQDLLGKVIPEGGESAADHSAPAATPGSETGGAETQPSPGTSATAAPTGTPGTKAQEKAPPKNAAKSPAKAPSKPASKPASKKKSGG